MRDCNRFINAVLENQLLRSCELVEFFLTKNPDDFHVIKLRYKNLPTLAMKDYHSLTGTLDLTYYNDKSHSSEFNLQNIERKRNILKEINTNLKYAISCIDNLNKYMENLSKLFSDLEIEYKSKDYTFDSQNNSKKFKDELKNNNISLYTFVFDDELKSNNVKENNKMNDVIKNIKKIPEGVLIFVDNFLNIKMVFQNISRKYKPKNIFRINSKSYDNIYFDYH